MSMHAARSFPLHSIFTHPFGRSRPVYDAPNDGGAPTPEPTPTPAPDQLAELVAGMAALRAEMAALKATPAPTPAPVPTTDQGKPTITPITPDLSTLPPIARIAAGYRR